MGFFKKKKKATCSFCENELPAEPYQIVIKGLSGESPYPICNECEMLFGVIADKIKETNEDD